MLSLRLVIENPWCKEEFWNVWDWTRKLWGHKVLELQLYKFNKELLGCAVTTQWRGRDHAGPELELIAFGRTLAIKIYDSRHWDYHNNRWEEYNKENTCQNQNQ